MTALLCCRLEAGLWKKNFSTLEFVKPLLGSDFWFCFFSWPSHVNALSLRQGFAFGLLQTHFFVAPFHPSSVCCLFVNHLVPAFVRKYNTDFSLPSCLHKASCASSFSAGVGQGLQLRGRKEKDSGTDKRKRLQGKW